MDGLKTQRQFSGPEFIPKTPPQKSLAFLVKLIVGIVITAGVVGGGALVSRVWDPVWNPFRPSPEEVLSQMQEKMETVETFHTKGKVFFSIKPEGQEEAKITLNFSGDSDVTNLEVQKMAGEFDINAFLPQQWQFTLKLESKVIGEDSYIKAEIPSYLYYFLTLAYGIDAQKINNRWIQFNKEALSSLSESYSQEELSKEQQEALMERFKEILSGRKVYYVKAELPDEKINGRNSYHYEIALDRQGLKEALPELLEALMEISGQQLGGFESAFMTGGIAQAIDEFLGKVGEITGEVWIGKKDMYLYKIKGEKEIDVSKLLEGSEGKELGKVTLRVEINYSNFNQEIKIEAPKEFIPFEEIFLQEFSTLPGTANSF